MKTKKYTHGIFSVVDYISVGAMLLLIGRFLYTCIEWIVAVVQGDHSWSTLEWEFVLLFLAFCIVWFALVIIPLLNMFSKFIISDEGIHVRMFNYWFFWKFIPWDKVESFERSSKRDHLWILRVDEALTIWHRSLARIFSPDDDSVIIALNTIRNWSGFKRRVKKYLAEKN